MKSSNKLYVAGFLLVTLIGIVLLIVGIFYRNKDYSDYIETEAIVQGVSIRDNGHGAEYKPMLLFFKDEYGTTHSVGCNVWFNRVLMSGDKIPILYKKGDPSITIVSNTDKNTFSYAFMVIGGVLIVAGIVLAGKNLYDYKRRKKV